MVDESGNFGIKESGSIFNLRFLTLGHKYRSKHRWNRY